jgi:site-specific DNA-cytosine methylase
MRVLIACEESQTVCKAFRERGHEAYSCDIQDCSGGEEDWHIVGDAVDVAYNWHLFYTQNYRQHYVEEWDLMIAHPPCTYLSRAGQAWKTRKQSVRPDMKEFREAEAAKAIEFMRLLWNAPIKKICLENPVGLANTGFRKPNQIIHPYYFGDAEMKETCLWLKGLPRLNGLHHIDKYKNKPKPTPGKSRIGSDGKLKNQYFCGRMDNKSGAAKLKSKTFPGIARAMAEQWGINNG